MKDKPANQEIQARSLKYQEPAQPDPVTCLYSNKCIEGCIESEPLQSSSQLLNRLSPYHKRQAETLFKNVERLVSLAPSPDYVGFLTLTFKDNVKDNKEASRRFKSFRTNYLTPSTDYGHWLLVKERQKRGAWHYHMIVICRENIREGFSLAKYQWWLDQRNKGLKRRLNTGNEFLRSLWEKNREACSKYGFGIPHLIPVLGTPEQMARYVGKYVSKHIGTRKPEDKGVRIIQTSQGWPKNSVKFAWNTDNAKLWRRNVNFFATIFRCTDEYELQRMFGRNWAYIYQEVIIGITQHIDEREKEIPF